MYTKTFVCLANSRKTAGRCIAGKEVFPNGSFGPWVRPVSSRPTHELSERERMFIHRADLRLLDVVEVPLKSPLPLQHQTENHLIEDRPTWVRRGLCSFQQIRNAVDVVDSLWGIGSSSRYGLNDRVSAAVARQFDYSLLLVNPQAFCLEVSLERTEFAERHRVRASFTFRGDVYKFPVTDPIMEQHYLSQPLGDYELGPVLLCVSLGTPHTDGLCYKFCAGIIAPPRWKA